MRVLCLDTSGPAVNVCASDGERLCALTASLSVRHAQSLMGAVSSALATLGLAAADVDLIAAVTGPGSFTGIRIGVSAARGLSHATGAPCVGVSALEAIAHPHAWFEGTVLALVDARNAQAFAAGYAGGADALSPRAGAVSDILSALPPGPVLCAGDGAGVNRALIRDVLGGRASFVPDAYAGLRPEAMLALAVRDARLAGRPDALVPVYLRDSSAQRAKEGEKI